MTDSRLDDLLWRWAAWCVNGTTSYNVTSWLRERGGSKRLNAAFESDVDCVEYRIEVGVAELAKLNPLAAKVLRTEYRVRSGKSTTQTDRAIGLDMPLRTYKARLKLARDHVADRIFKNTK